jgi:uncharacterized membrane protein
MSLRPDVLLAIIGMAIATYACRAGGYAIFRATRPPRFVEVMLRHLPGPIFMAFIAPALAAQGVAAFAAAAAVVVAQAVTRSLVAAIAAGVGTLSLLNWFGLS